MKRILHTHIGHDDGAIFLRLIDGVVAAPLAVVLASLQDGELEVEVGVEREDDGQRRQDDVRHERGHHVGEGRGEAVARRGGGESQISSRLMVSACLVAGETDYRSRAARLIGRMACVVPGNLHETEGNLEDVALGCEVQEAVDDAASSPRAELEDALLLAVVEPGHCWLVVVDARLDLGFEWVLNENRAG